MCESIIINVEPGRNLITPKTFKLLVQLSHAVISRRVGESWERGGSYRSHDNFTQERIKGAEKASAIHTLFHG